MRFNAGIRTRYTRRNKAVCPLPHPFARRFRNGILSIAIANARRTRRSLKTACRLGCITTYWTAHTKRVRLILQCRTLLVVHVVVKSHFAGINLAGLKLNMRCLESDDRPFDSVQLRLPPQ